MFASISRWLSLASGLTLTALVVACNNGGTLEDSKIAAANGSFAPTTAEVLVDGSSTVYPIATATLQRFQAQMPENTGISLSFSGTGGGFEKFCAGETHINNASRPISSEEIAACDRAGIRYIELPIAYDAITVVVHPQNDWAESITLEELEKIWEPQAQGKVTTWQQVRPEWPDRPINLYGPGTDSGTYDYFTDVVVGGSGRSDYVASEDDTLLVQAVSNDPNALGYFGYAYYQENPEKLSALAVDSGTGAVLPSEEAVLRAKYQPLARPLFIYVNLQTAQSNRTLQKFVEFYLENAPEIVEEVGYIPLPEEGYRLALLNFYEGEVGTAFNGEPQPTLTIAELLRQEKRFQ